MLHQTSHVLTWMWSMTKWSGSSPLYSALLSAFFNRCRRNSADFLGQRPWAVPWTLDWKRRKLNQPGVLGIMIATQKFASVRRKAATELHHHDLVWHFNFCYSSQWKDGKLCKWTMKKRTWAWRPTPPMKRLKGMISLWAITFFR